MPLVEVIRKRGARDLSPQNWSLVAGLLKSAVASGVNEIMKPEPLLLATKVHVYWSDKSGCRDAPDLFVTIDFTTGEEVGLTPAPKQNKELRVWVQGILEASPLVAGMQIAVYVRPFRDASFGMTERQIYAA